jgi:CAAX protease family protein
MTFCPLMAASVLVFRENGTAAVTELLRRSFDCKRIRAKVWYAPIVLLMPGVMPLTYALIREFTTSNRALPDPGGPGAAVCALYRSFG